MTTHVLIRHTVKDYDHWKARFDANSATRAAFTSKKGHIFRDEGNPSMVTVLVHFEDAQKAHAFAESPALAEAMQESGVEGETAFIFFGQEEKFVD